MFVLVFIHNICGAQNNCCWFLLDFSNIWHFGYRTKTRCRISLIYAVGKDGNGTRGKIPVLVHSLSVGSSYESITNYRKPVATHKSIHFVASSQSCKIEGSQPRLLADRPFHAPSLPCGLSLSQQKSKQHRLELCKGFNWRAVGKARSETFGQPISWNQGFSTGRGMSYVTLKTLLLYCVNCQLLQNKSIRWYPYLVISFSWW